MKLTRSLEVMPFDKAFETENGRELCHATGNLVYLGDDEEGKDPSEWWIEYVDSEGDYHYGR